MAGPLLNPEEVNALMSAIQDGRVSPEQPRNRNSAVNYDLTSQDRVIHRQMPTLDAINEQIASQFGMGIAGRTRLSVRVSSGPASLLRFNDFNSILAPPATVTVLSLGKASAQALLVLEPGLADAMIAAALGDKRGRTDEPAPNAEAPTRRDFTIVERNVLRRLLLVFTEAMQLAWAPVLPFKPEVLRFESDPRLAVISPGTEAAVLSSFELEGAIRGVIQLAIPYTAIEPAKKALMSPPKLNSTSDERFMSALRDEINQVEVRLTALLGKTTLSVRQILDLEPGAVVMLGTSEGASLPVFVQGKAKFTGQPKVVGGAIAVELDHGPVSEFRRPFETDPTPPPDSRKAA
ncbi:MAG: FliM/FliN family flagellar motor switch protein [Myxococcaceae bacterium]|nr:FliM/FliN family flagellar motor switch protein [Myxococcaceae bacterium]MCA3014801.1 FliM/FliN family flagellar motor switch protein [Myxococcaceae bacterium]